MEKITFPQMTSPCAGGAQGLWARPTTPRRRVCKQRRELGWPLTPVYSMGAILPFLTHGSFSSAGR